MGFETGQDFRGEALSAVRGARLIFSGLSFSVPAGAALRLAGPNGGGKSTLMRTMAGLLRPTAGALHWGETSVQDDPDAHAKRLAYLGHADALKPALTAAENVTFALNLRGQDPSKRLGPAFEAMDITALMDLPSGWLSSGQKRRTALAAIIASDAPVWLLDEPTVGLDKKAVAALESAMATHLEAGGRVVAATHTALDLGPQAADLDPQRSSRSAWLTRCPTGVRLGMKSLLSIVARDLLLPADRGRIRHDRLVLRGGGEPVSASLGPTPELLARIAPAVLWVTALLAAMLSFDRLFQQDADDGGFDQPALSGQPLALVALQRRPRTGSRQVCQ